MGVSREYMFQTKEEDANDCLSISNQHTAAGKGAYRQEQVRVPEQADHAQWVQPFPHLACFLRRREALQLSGAFVMDRLGLQEEAEDDCNPGECGLEPEDVSPGSKCHNDAAYEGAESWSDEGTAQEPSKGCCAFSLMLG